MPAACDVMFSILDHLIGQPCSKGVTENDKSFAFEGASAYEIGRGDENDWMRKNDDVQSMESTTCVKFDIQQGHLNNTTA